MTLLLTYPENLQPLEPAACDLQEVLQDILPRVEEHAEQGDDPKGIMNAINAAYSYSEDVKEILAELIDDLSEDTIKAVEEVLSELNDCLVELTWHDMSDEVDLYDIEEAAKDVEAFGQMLKEAIVEATFVA